MTYYEASCRCGQAFVRDNVWDAENAMFRHWRDDKCDMPGVVCRAPEPQLGEPITWATARRISADGP